MTANVRSSCRRGSTKRLTRCSGLKASMLTDRKWLAKQCRWNYYRCMWTYATLVSGIGAIAIGLVQDLPAVDCLFLSVSAFTCTGLSTLEMSDLSPATFVVCFILMFLGGTVFLLLPPMQFRIYSFAKLEPLLQDFMSHHVTNLDNPKTKLAIKLISGRRALVRGLRIVSFATTLYMLLWLGIGTALFYLILESHDPIPEIAERKFSSGWVATFTVLSAFNNAGLTHMSDSLVQLRTWPGAWFLFSLLILAGNNFTPIFLRWLLGALHRLSAWLPLDRDAIRYALDHPRQMTTHLFDKRNTQLLAYTLFAINLFQWVLFLVSTLPRDFVDDSSNDVSDRVLVGAGLFQTISTRVAGLAMLNLNDLNQGMLMTYIIFMYISIAPFVSRMYVTEQTYDASAQHTHSRRTAKDTQSLFSHGYLFRHLSWLTLSLFVVTFVEDSNGEIAGRMDPNRAKIHPFSLLFELVSAYGNVGLSLGVATRNYSLCGQFSVVSKLFVVTCLVGPAIHNFKFAKLRKALLSAQEAANNIEKMHRKTRRKSFLNIVPGVGKQKCSVHDELTAAQAQKVLLQGFEEVHNAMAQCTPPVTPSAGPMLGIQVESTSHLIVDRIQNSDHTQTLEHAAEATNAQLPVSPLLSAERPRRQTEQASGIRQGSLMMKRCNTIALATLKPYASPPAGSVLREQQQQQQPTSCGAEPHELSGVQVDVCVDGAGVGLGLHSLVWWSWASGDGDGGRRYRELVGDEVGDGAPRKFAWCSWYRGQDGLPPLDEEAEDSEDDGCEEEQEQEQEEQGRGEKPRLGGSDESWGSSDPSGGWRRPLSDSVTTDNNETEAESSALAAVAGRRWRRSLVPAWVSSKWNAAWLPTMSEASDDTDGVRHEDLMETDSLFRRYFPVESDLNPAPIGQVAHTSAPTTHTRHSADGHHGMAFSSRESGAGRRSWDVVRRALFSRSRPSADDMEAGPQRLRRENTMSVLKQKLQSDVHVNVRPRGQGV